MANKRRPDTNAVAAPAIAAGWRALRLVASTLSEPSDSAFSAALRAVVASPGVEGASLTLTPTTEIGLPLEFLEGIPPYPSSAFVREYTDGDVEAGRLEVRLTMTTPLMEEWAATAADLIGHAVLRRRRERAAIAAQREEVVSAITAGVAHDLNNVMTAVIGSTSLLRMHPSADDEVRRLADQIEEVAWGGSRLARELLRFVRGLDEPEPAISVSEILEGALQLVRPLLRSTAVEVGEVEGQPQVAGVRVLIEQAVVNLLLHHGRAAGSTGVTVGVRSAHGHIGITVRGGTAGGEQTARRGWDLATAALIAERHGGSLRPGTTEDTASHLLTLPLATQTATAPGLGAV